MTENFKPNFRIVVFYKNGDTEYCPVMLSEDGTAPSHRDWADNRPGHWTCNDGQWLYDGQEAMPEGAINFRVDRVQPEPWCEPLEAGLASEAKAVGKRFSELLTALGNIDHNIIKGSLADELRDLRISLHERLKAEGWRITGLQNGWKVLPPKRRALKR